VLTLAVLASAANAAVLWDQSALDTGQTSVGLLNTVSPGFNGMVIFDVNDVTVPAGGWTIQSISSYFTTFNSAGTSAVLNVFPKSGNLPLATDNPKASPIGSGTTVAVSSNEFVFNSQGIREYTASGLNIVLAPGEYWIGLTPVQPTGPFGADNQWSTTSPMGVGSAGRSDDFGPNWFNYGGLAGAASTLDGAMKIQGIPAPGAMALLGLGGLVAGRRRR
jgi:uncharacterized protein (TIGR03382 family)